MSIRVIEAGVLDTIQDLGRHGFASMGINPGGAMDTTAASIANFLAGNEETKAVIELHYPAPVLRFDHPAIIALTGADFSPTVNDDAIPLNTPILLTAGSRLWFKKLKHGARCYLAVAGGIAAEKWLNSYSTNMKAGAGGWHGRQLKKQDALPVKPLLSHEPKDVQALPWHADVSPFYRTDNLLRIIKGHEHDLLTDCSRSIFEANTFCISPQSDRMGYRMNGSPLKLKEPIDLLSSAVTRGTIQLLPNGQLIILMADHQTTGGYPRLRHVISADLATLAQLQPTSAIRFREISITEAHLTFLHQQQHLQQIKTACDFRLREYLAS